MTYEEQVDRVISLLQSLDGTRESRVALLAGVDRETLERLGGVDAA